MKDILLNLIQQKRPNISASSGKTYASYLKSILLNRVSSEDEIIPYLNNHTDNILQEIEGKPISTQKSILSALFILTENPIYQERMMNLIKQKSEEDIKQKKSATEKKNWISYSDIQQKFTELSSTALKDLKRKSNHNFPELNKYILFCLSSGVFYPPRRSLDVELKIKDFDRDTENYYEKGKIVLNRYKTVNKYGRYEINVKKDYPELYSILQNWIKINPTPYMLFSSNMNKLTSPQITKLNNQIWGKNVSVDIYRHAYITAFYEGTTPTMEQITNLAKQMGHSVNQSLLYRKVD